MWVAVCAQYSCNEGSGNTANDFPRLSFEHGIGEPETRQNVRSDWDLKTSVRETTEDWRQVGMLPTQRMPRDFTRAQYQNSTHKIHSSYLSFYAANDHGISIAL